jgi:hypothetical protein
MPFIFKYLKIYSYLKITAYTFLSSHRYLVSYQIILMFVDIRVVLMESKKRNSTRAKDRQTYWISLLGNKFSVF